MIKFETINGTPCRMVEPEPLTPEANFPCVVRLIQDDSRLGILNKLLHEGCYHEIYLCTSCNNHVCHILINGEEYDDFYPKYEIIGYPVEDGSHYWALYQMMQGKKVSYKSAIGNACWALNQDGNVQFCYMDDLAYIGTIRSKLEFAENYALETGWHLYEPQPKPKPKPLLADAKVGWLCKRRDGRVVSLSNVPPDSLYWEVGNNLYYQDGRESHYEERDVDIVYTEPLAPEGSAEWAWQMLILQKPVSHPAQGIWRDTYYSRDGFVRCMEKTGWQLYEPDHDFNVGDWVELNCHNKHQGKIKEMFTETYAVDGLQLYSYPTFTITGLSGHFGFSSIARKLSPSEVIVNIGCLSGTVAPGCSDATIMIVPIGYNGFGDVAIIPVAMLDAPTRELVESLLKAQEDK